MKAQKTNTNKTKAGSKARQIDKIVSPETWCPGEAKLHPGL